MGVLGTVGPTLTGIDAGHLRVGLTPVRSVPAGDVMAAVDAVVRGSPATGTFRSFGALPALQSGHVRPCPGQPGYALREGPCLSGRSFV